MWGVWSVSVSVCGGRGRCGECVITRSQSHRILPVGMWALGEGTARVTEVGGESVLEKRGVLTGEQGHVWLCGGLHGRWAGRGTLGQLGWAGLTAWARSPCNEAFGNF